jgi:hypothetical protein
MAAIAACVHTARRPAASLVRSACEKAFDEEHDKFLVDSERNRSLDKISRGYEYIERTFPSEVTELLAKDKSACLRARDFADVQKDLKTKMETVAQTAKLLDRRESELSDLAQTRMMTDPFFVRKSLCVLTCGSNKERKCADYCSVDEKFIEDLASNALYMRLYNACSPKVNEFQSELELRLPIWSKMLKFSLWPAYHELTLLAQRARLALHEVEAQLAHDKKSEGVRSCDPPLPRWRNSARSSVDTVKGPGGQGSAFYVTDGKEIRAVTADHIYNEAEGWGEKEERPLLFGETGRRHLHHRPVSLLVKPEAGYYSHGDDIIQTKITAPRKTLPLAPMDARAKSGQPFYILGYPQMKNYRFTIYRCTFYGYSTSKVSYSNSTVYVLRCPSVDGHIAGMSGGPVLDESGRVWGLITDHNPFLARVFVAPLSAAPDGEILMGIQQTFLSDSCVPQNQVEPRACQVNPLGIGSVGP